jgi:hypothetical protein
MTFPVLLIVGSAIFSFTVAYTSREHLWKKSNLPLLFHGLGTREREMFGEIEDYIDMRDTAKRLTVKLGNTEQSRLRFIEAERPDMTVRY